MDDNGAQPNIRSAFQPVEIENIDKPDISARRRAAEVDYTPAYDCPPVRRPASEREDAFRVTDWLFDGAVGLVDELLHHDLWLPEEFWVHAYAAQREGKMALRIAMDEIRRQTNARRQKELKREQRRERRGDIEIDF